MIQPAVLPAVPYSGMRHWQPFGFAQGRPVECEALGTIEPTGPTERVLAGLLLAGYKRRLRAIVEAVPDWVAEEILSASERIGDRRAAVWLSEN